MSHLLQCQKRIYISALLSSTPAVSPHEGVAPHRVQHLDEGEWPHSDLTGPLHLKARLLVEGNQEVFTHEDSTAHVGQATQVLQVTPHQDGAFALLAEGAVDGQDVDVDCGPVGLVESEGVLGETVGETVTVRSSFSVMSEIINTQVEFNSLRGFDKALFSHNTVCPPHLY